MLQLVITFLAFSLFDLEMTQQQKKDTGIAKLSEKERSYLQNWIDNNFNKREHSLTETAQLQMPIIEDNLNNGKHLRLSDRSLWEINLEDTLLTQSWITPVEILIMHGNDSDYPYRLTNSLTGSSVGARRIQQIPGAKYPTQIVTN